MDSAVKSSVKLKKKLTFKIYGWSLACILISLFLGLLLWGFFTLIVSDPNTTVAAGIIIPALFIYIILTIYIFFQKFKILGNQQSAIGPIHFIVLNILDLSIIIALVLFICDLSLSQIFIIIIVSMLIFVIFLMCCKFAKMDISFKQELAESIAKMAGFLALCFILCLCFLLPLQLLTNANWVNIPLFLISTLIDCIFIILVIIYADHQIDEIIGNENQKLSLISICICDIMTSFINLFLDIVQLWWSIEKK